MLFFCGERTFAKVLSPHPSFKNFYCIFWLAQKAKQGDTIRKGCIPGITWGTVPSYPVYPRAAKRTAIFRAGNHALRASAEASSTGQGFSGLSLAEIRSPKEIRRLPFRFLKLRQPTPALISTMKSPYRLPIQLFRAQLVRRTFHSVRRNRLFTLFIFAWRKYFCFQVAGTTVCPPLSCASYCLSFVPKASARRCRSPGKRCASRCKTCVPKAREKGWRNRVHTNVGVLCTVERANAVKAPLVS